MEKNAAREEGNSQCRGIQCVAVDGEKSRGDYGGNRLPWDLKAVNAWLVSQALLVDYICVIPLSAAVVLPVLYACKRGNVVVLLFMCITAMVIICKHIENVRRIFRGMEVRISYLWNREGEISRIKENRDKNAEC